MASFDLPDSSPENDILPVPLMLNLPSVDASVFSQILRCENHDQSPDGSFTIAAYAGLGLLLASKINGCCPKRHVRRSLSPQNVTRSITSLCLLKIAKSFAYASALSVEIFYRRWFAAAKTTSSKAATELTSGRLRES